MIIDADCHISADPARYGIGIDQLLRQMDALGVERAVCWPMVSYTREMAADVGAIVAGAKAHPDRIIPFGGVNPMLGLERALAELQRYIEVDGVRGIKLNGARDNYCIDDPRLSLPLVEKIAQAGIVLALHCGAPDGEKTHPWRIARISALLPELRILVVHMGGGNPTLHEAVVDLAVQHPTWQLVDSEADYRQILRALQILGPRRLCYGSDTPFCPMRYEWGLRQVIYQDLSAEDKALVLGGNIARLLGL